METETYEKELLLLPPVDLAAEIVRLKDELMIERDRTLRSVADFTNYRKRIERDGTKLADEGKREMILLLLDVIDDMERALQCGNDTEHTFIKGVRNIHKKLIELLERQGVVPFDSLGKLFDHNMHEAVAMVKLDDSLPGIIVEEFRRGYLWNNVLLFAAKVRVAE